MYFYLRSRVIMLGLMLKDLVLGIPRKAATFVITLVFWPIGFVKGLVFGNELKLLEDKRSQ